MTEEKSMAEEKTTPIEPNASYLPGTPEESVSPEDTPAPTTPVPPSAKKRRPLRIALALLTFILGIAVGIAAVLLLILAMSGTNPPITTAPPQPGNITNVLQPYADACNLQMHILKADYGSIPVIGFASIFEKQINNKLQQVIPSTVLKGSYALCLSSVNTQTGNIILAFSVTPLPS